MEHYDVEANMVTAKYGTIHTILIVIITLFTLGLGYLIVIFMKRIWIKEVTETGVVSMNGTQFEWSQLTNKEDVLKRVQIAELGEAYKGPVVLLFDGGRVVINPILVANDRELLLFIGNKIR